MQERFKLKRHAETENHAKVKATPDNDNNYSTKKMLSEINVKYRITSLFIK